jgi:hypothetical protein
MTRRRTANLAPLRAAATAQAPPASHRGAAVLAPSRAAATRRPRP